jgi:SAM-dependent methyltransferase
MSDHVTVNRDFWNGMAKDWAAAGEYAWASDEVTWGNWSLPNAELQLLPEDMSGMDAIELGCGTGYVSAWMARRGARVTGIDVSAEQLATAERLRAEHGLDIAFIEGNAEATGLPDASFDFAISEYGAAIWCDPDLWLPEAHRLLRPGGTLVFLGNHPMTLLTTPLNGAPCDTSLHRAYRDLKGADWTEVEFDPGGIEFNRTISGWMALFDAVGFDLLRYQELFAPKDAEGDRYSVPSAWAKAYPAEQVWSLRRRG